MGSSLKRFSGVASRMAKNLRPGAVAATLSGLILVEATTTTEVIPVKSVFGNFGRFLADNFMIASNLAYLEGKAQARRDLSAGKMVLRTYGKAAKWRDAYAELLLNRYKVELQSVAGEEVSERQREETHGYNSVMKEAIRSRYGKDFLDAVVEEAKEAHLKREKAGLLSQQQALG